MVPIASQSVFKLDLLMVSTLVTAVVPVFFHVCRSLRRVRNHPQKSVHPFRAFSNSFPSSEPTQPLYYAQLTTQTEDGNPVVILFLLSFPFPIIT